MNAIAKAPLLTFLSLSAFALAEPTTPPAETPNASVGISSRDGLTLSGTEVLITRNGVSQRLTKEMAFTSGAKILPDGTLVGTDGSKTMIRPGQIVTLDGKLMNAPVVETGNPGGTSVAPQPKQ